LGWGAKLTRCVWEKVLRTKEEPTRKKTEDAEITQGGIS
jgi:hypothetical protein